MKPFLLLGGLNKPLLAKAVVAGSRSLPWLWIATHSPFVSEGVRNMFRWAVGFVGGSVVVFSGVVLANAVEKSPFTGRWRLCMTSPEEDIEVGYRLSQNMLSKFTRDQVLSGSHPLVRSIQQIANKLIDTCGNTEMVANTPTIRVVVVSDSSTAVYSLPNGDIVLHAGLIGSLDSVDELAVVLAHEIAHVICRHSAEIVTVSDLLAIPSGFLYSHVASAGNAGALVRWLALKMARPERLLAELPVSRKIEIEADIVGVRLMGTAGFDPNVAHAYWDRIARENNNCFTSTHPGGSERRAAIKTELDGRRGEEFFFKTTTPTDPALDESVKYWINRVRTEMVAAAV